MLYFISHSLTLTHSYTHTHFRPRISLSDNDHGFETDDPKMKKIFLLVSPPPMEIVKNNAKMHLRTIQIKRDILRQFNDPPLLYCDILYFLDHCFKNIYALTRELIHNKV
jgi:hypothetical protein